MKTEQRDTNVKSKATEGAIVNDRTLIETALWKLFNKGKYNFVKQLLLNLHNSREPKLRMRDHSRQTGQANKSARGMPWHQEPMKDATSCDKLRGAANKR